MYNIELSGADIENILKALGGAEENEILRYETVGKLWDYLTGEVEKQRAGTVFNKSIEFKDFKNCELTTDEILKIKLFEGADRNDFMRYLYSVVFHTNINIADKTDLQKIISAYIAYKHGKFGVVII